MSCTIVLEKIFNTIERFVNQEKYFYLILFLLHINAAVYIETTAYIAAEMMLVKYLKHICKMFNNICLI